jgi:hypothetical protein
MAIRNALQVTPALSQNIMKHFILSILVLSIYSSLFSQNEIKGCYDGIGSSKGDEPALTLIMSSGDTIAICGYLNKRISAREIYISEFDVFNFQTGESYVTYGAVERCHLIANRDTILIETFAFMPAGENWKWSEFKISSRLITSEADNLIVNKEIPLKPSVKLSKEDINHFLTKLEDLKNKGDLINAHEIIGRLFVCSISGNQECSRMLNDFPEVFSNTPDGHIAEQWKEFKALEKWIKI